MKKKKNKLIILLVILAILVVAWFFFKKNNLSYIPTPVEESPAQTEGNPTIISITSEDIKEENFSGTKPKISGPGELVTIAQNYVEQTITEFKKEADVDVPNMRNKFGADSSVTQYEINISARYIKNEKTHSIIMQIYTYTGGAHGNSVYKVVTAGLAPEKVLSLSDVIKKDRQRDFVTLVKKELGNWRRGDTSGLGLFPESVQDLSFDSFSNWSLSEKNLIIYFDQYAIGPGALGSVEFPLLFSKITEFLNLEF